MAKPRIFISSTFYDLKHIRSSIEVFIETLGYEPVLSEKGNIAYNPDIPLDESCYREAASCDIFVLIIGGRYGSAASGEQQKLPKTFYDRYESITKREYESAVARDVPVYILIDRSVYAEYETYRRNRDNPKTRYAHVDSVNVFQLIDDILAQPRNNPIRPFDRHSDIETWLREQWAGLFKEMVSRRSEQAQLASLGGQVAELANVNTTLKRYLEVVMSHVSEKKAAEEIIKDEDRRLAESRKLQEFTENKVVREITQITEMSVDTLRKVFTESKGIEELARKFEAENKGHMPWESKRMVEYWREDKAVVERLNEVRKILDLPPLEFTEDAAARNDSNGKKAAADKPRPTKRSTGSPKKRASR